MSLRGERSRNTVISKLCWLLTNLSKRKYTQKEIRKELNISPRTVHRYMETLSLHFCLCSEQNGTNLCYWIERGKGRKQIWED